MNHLLDDDDDLNHHRSSSRDKEVTLGTGMVLGIFFALALICAVFFGFGYTLGRKSAQPAPVADTTETTPPANSSSFSNFKPSPGSPASTASQTKKPASSDDGPTVATTTPPPAPAPKPIPKPSSGTPLASPAPVRTTAPVERATAAAVPVLSQGGNLVVGGASIMVQIAAVSHQEDADVLTSALKRHGYAVSNHTNTGDKLIHVQIGPYSNKKDAEAMRQRLQGDGYNAILK